MNVILLAPIAAGKGTIAEKMSEEYDFVSISTGALFREIIATGSDLGKELDAIIQSGALVGDSLTKRALLKKIESLGADKSFILDGYPRNLSQVNDLQEIFRELNLEEPKVIFINISEQTALERTLGRRVCPTCKKTYNIFFEGFKPNEDNTCNICNTEVISRNDDNEETFRKRFNTYINETLPIIDYYRKNSEFLEIDGTKESEDKMNEIANFLRINK